MLSSYMRLSSYLRLSSYFMTSSYMWGTLPIYGNFATLNALVPLKVAKVSLELHLGTTPGLVGSGLVRSCGSNSDYKAFSVQMQLQVLTGADLGNFDDAKTRCVSVYYQGNVWIIASEGFWKFCQCSKFHLVLLSLDARIFP